jgi:hypothetical protein
MTKRIINASDLRKILLKMKDSPHLEKILNKQGHVAGKWDIEHLIEQLVQLVLVFKQNAVVVCHFDGDKPTSLFAGLISEDWACAKLGLTEIVWVSVEPSLFGGFRVLQEVEKIIVHQKVDFFSMNYMCNGGDPRIQSFLMNNGFRLDTLSFVKNYK